jgi:hypothetical protein
MAKTSIGHIQQLPSGSFGVKVYAGTGPVTGKARLRRQTCPDEAAAYAALSRMLVEAGGGRFPANRRLSARRSWPVRDGCPRRCRSSTMAPNGIGRAPYAAYQAQTRSLSHEQRLELRKSAE